MVLVSGHIRSNCQLHYLTVRYGYTLKTFLRYYSHPAVADTFHINRDAEGSVYQCMTAWTAGNKAFSGAGDAAGEQGRRALSWLAGVQLDCVEELVMASVPLLSFGGSATGGGGRVVVC